ncbi:hypothetical protein DFQ26_001307 [Actinomortierella ambigua]|nr:hypothetical protein DFQ26_001307 [Actinomortierella ambigua]
MEDQMDDQRLVPSGSPSSKLNGVSSNGGSTSPATAASAAKAKPKTEPAPKTFRFEGSISSESFKTTKSFDLAGVNILNRKPLDTKTALDKLQRRRETHNRVERKRRDCINQLIDDLTRLLPPKHLQEVTSKCHRVNVLRGAVAHIKFLHDTNDSLTKSIEAAKRGEPLPEIVPPPVAPSSAAASSSSPTPSSTTEHAKGEGESGGESPAPPETEGEMETEAEAKADEYAENTSKVKVEEDTAMDIDSELGSTTKSPAPSISVNTKSLPPVIITTNAPSPAPSSDTEVAKPSNTKSQNRTVPPISITTPADAYSLESRRDRHGSWQSNVSDSTSPFLSPFPASPVGPPSPITPTSASSSGASLALRQNVSPSEDSSSRPSPAPSPSLPPISSLASIHIKSPSTGPEGGDRAAIKEDVRRSERGSPTAEGEAGSPNSTPPPASSAAASASAGSRPSHHRAGPTLPPLMIPAPEHLHPSYSSTSHRQHHHGQTLTPHGNGPSPRYRSSDNEHLSPVSPYMLSPSSMASRSPSVGPLPSPAGLSPYPHWSNGAEGGPGAAGTVAAAGGEANGGGGHHMPPPSPGAPPVSPHGYHHPYPYPYPYHHPHPHAHPSYGYPYPPPPPHGGHPPHPSHHAAHHERSRSQDRFEGSSGREEVSMSMSKQQQQLQAPQQDRSRKPSLQPEPIFIQEEPWVVSRKRASSNNGSAKTSSTGAAGGKGGQGRTSKAARDASPATTTAATTAAAAAATPATGTANANRNNSKEPVSPTLSTASIESSFSVSSTNKKKRAQKDDHASVEDGSCEVNGRKRTRGSGTKQPSGIEEEGEEAERNVEEDDEEVAELSRSRSSSPSSTATKTDGPSTPPRMAKVSVILTETNGDELMLEASAAASSPVKDTSKINNMPSVVVVEMADGSEDHDAAHTLTSLAQH